MKKNKPKSMRQKFEYVAITFGVIAAYVLIIPIAIIPVVIYFYLVVRPITRAVETEPLYWLNWKEVKRKSGRKTGAVLSTLCGAARPDRIFDARLRPENDLRRLEKFLKRKRPAITFPLMPEHVVFYEFRRKAGGPRKRFWNYAPVFQMQRPAYA